MILEVCCADLESARAAALAGAPRIELCTDLDADGLTPSADVLQAARQLPSLLVHVLIRPRAGDFVYNAAEADVIEQQLCTALGIGADGVVIGALTSSGAIDVALCRRLLKHVDACRAAGRHVACTFHRAFDHAIQPPLEALDDLIDLGFTHLLTSGRQPTAQEGIPLLRSLVSHAAGRITIIPASGITPANARLVIDATDATQIHGSLRALQSDGMMHSDVNLIRQTLLTLCP